MIRTEWKNHFVLDVESDGPCPGLHNMISFALVSVYAPAYGIKVTVKPELPESQSISASRTITNVTYLEQARIGMPVRAGLIQASSYMQGFSDHLTIKLWSDNPAFDWQWWSYNCAAHNVNNCAGHSMRRIGDLYAGWKGRPRDTKGWQVLRMTPHSHDPLDDARGNAEALHHIIEAMEK